MSYPASVSVANLMSCHFPRVSTAWNTTRQDCKNRVVSKPGSGLLDLCRKNTKDDVHTVAFQVKLLKQRHLGDVIECDVRQLFVHTLAKNVFNPQNILSKSRLANPREPDPHSVLVQGQ